MQSLLALVTSTHPTPTLTTDRLHLRPLLPSDLDAFQRLHDDAEVTRYLAPPRPLTHPESFRLLAQVLGHWQLRGYGYWAVSLNQGPFIGMVGLWFPEGWPGVELGWRLQPEFWGKGLALDASRAVMRHAFDALQLPELLSIIRADNQRSIRLAERLGMECYATRTIAEIDVLTYGVCRST